MPTAVAQIPLPGLPTAVPAPAGTDAGATGAVDFAALLLGQLVGDVARNILPATATAEAIDSAEASDTPLADGIADPALMLAAMGLVIDPRGPQAAASPTNPARLPGGEAPLSASLPLAGDADAALADSLAKQAAGDVSALPPTVDGRTAPADGKSPAFPLSPQTPANFAGAEPKLAEALAAPAEPQLHAASLHAPQAAPAPTAGANLQVATPVKDPAWPAEFGQKIVWMATQDRQNAQITLNPPQMGPIEISLSVKNDQASAIFVSTNAEVREVIESALPRLREMLAEVGVELGQTNVSAESFRQAQDGAGGERRAGGGAERRNDERFDTARGSGGATTGGTMRIGNGLVDTFA